MTTPFVSPELSSGTFQAIWDTLMQHYKVHVSPKLSHLSLSSVHY